MKRLSSESDRLFYITALAETEDISKSVEMERAKEMRNGERGWKG